MKFIISILFFSFSVFATAQKLSPGYIITNENDTILGKLEKLGSVAISKQCVFIARNSENRIIYKPEDIKGFKFFEGKFYISKTVTTLNPPKKLFIEYLINGIVDIYHYTDGFKSYYLLSDDEGNLHELTNEEKKIYGEYKTYAYDNNAYIGILNYVLRDGTKIKSKIPNTQLTHKSLINLAKNYHEEVCKDGECIIYEKKSKNRKIYIGPKIGYNALLIISSNSSGGKYLSAEKYLAGINFGYDQFVSAGLMMKMNFENTRERFFLVYNLDFYKSYHEIYHEYYDVFSAHNYDQNISILQKNISNSLEVKYEHPFNRFRANFGVGLFHSYAYKINFHNPPFFRVNNDSFINNIILSPNRFGTQTSIGLVKNIYRNFDIEINFQYQFGLGLYHNLFTHHFAANIAVPLLINKKD
jgi:hypothetical protein